MLSSDNNRYMVSSGINISLMGEFKAWDIFFAYLTSKHWNKQPFK